MLAGTAVEQHIIFGQDDTNAVHDGACGVDVPAEVDGVPPSRPEPVAQDRGQEPLDGAVEELRGRDGPRSVVVGRVPGRGRCLLG